MLTYSHRPLLGNNIQAIIWNLSTGEKTQAISCAFNGAVEAAVWFPSTLALRHGFAFGCADGSVHIYIPDKATVCEDPINYNLRLIDITQLNILFKTSFMMVLLWTTIYLSQLHTGLSSTLGLHFQVPHLAKPYPRTL